MKANSRWVRGNAGVAFALLAAFGLGLLVRGCFVANPRPAASDAGEPRGEAAAEVWTCSMHPQIRQPKFGKCPICGMDLIPVAVDTGAESDQPRQLKLSPSARRLAEVEVMPVERRSVPVELRLAGKVQFDETRLAYIAPRVAGRIDRLYANYVGMPVKAGDPLADLYSPELVSAQQELLQAAAAGKGPDSSMLPAARERLRQWGLTAGQVEEIERRGQVREHVTFYAPLGGVVVEKEAREGMYVEAGMRLFTLADLSQVWVQLDAYETDLAWLRPGQEVILQTEAYPGESFKGSIAFIDPVLDPVTRTLKVRVQAANADGRLKPEIFVRAVVHAEASGASAQPPLVIPASAPLVTGKRAVVYVAAPDQEGVYEGREVVLGPRAGDYYLVREGLQEGERVVVRGGFKIDSSLQIQGKPSMMTRGSEAKPDGPAHATPKPTATPEVIAAPESLRNQWGAVLDRVLAVTEGLARDELDTARAGAAAVSEQLAAVDLSVLEEAARKQGLESVEALTRSVEAMRAAKDITAFRAAFETLSNEMLRVVKTFGLLQSETLYVMHCPMAFDNRGANWLQKDASVRNPYFGKAMLACGEAVETIPAATHPPEEKGRSHE